ncbi:MAG: hypothetical protein ACREP0_04795 [Rhodanobacteraceae bacterium]
MPHILLTVLDLGGTFVFAISGAVAAVKHHRRRVGVLRAALHGDPPRLAPSARTGFRERDMMAYCGRFARRGDIAVGLTAARGGHARCIGAGA